MARGEARWWLPRPARAVPLHPSTCQHTTLTSSMSLAALGNLLKCSYPFCTLQKICHSLFMQMCPAHPMKILRIETIACLFYYDQLGQNLISLLCCSTQEEQTRQLLIQCLLMPQVVLLKDFMGHINCLEALLDLIKDILKDMLKDLLKNMLIV